MLPRKYRITKDKEFDFVFEKGKFFSASSISLKASSSQKGFDRFGFIVSSKVSKKANERAKVKRRLRAAAKNILRKEEKNSLDIVIIAKKCAVEKNFEELNKELFYLFKKAAAFFSR